MAQPAVFVNLREFRDEVLRLGLCADVDQLKGISFLDSSSSPEGLSHSLLLPQATAAPSSKAAILHTDSNLKMMGAAIELQKKATTDCPPPVVVLPNHHHSAKEHSKSDHDIISADELLITVSLYSSSSSEKLQEILVLGSQSLAELRDKFNCDFECRLRAIHPELSSHASFIFIEDVFYNDTRATSRTYSSNVIAWAKRSRDLQMPVSVNPGKFREDEMERTKFESLTVRLNVPYVFAHLGDCEHLLTFDDVRLYSAHSDFQSRAEFPFVKLDRKPRPRNCQICCITRASKILLNEPVAPENPCFVCDVCEKNLLHGAPVSASREILLL
jgi:snRNA-activating protein complex subunit 3